MSWTFLSRTEKKARKPHECIWCGQPIEKGQKYFREVGINDGDFQDNPFHPECVEACAEELRESYEDSFIPYENERPTNQHKEKP